MAAPRSRAESPAASAPVSPTTATMPPPPPLHNPPPQPAYHYAPHPHHPHNPFHHPHNAPQMAAFMQNPYFYHPAMHNNPYLQQQQQQQQFMLMMMMHQQQQQQHLYTENHPHYAPSPPPPAPHGQTAQGHYAPNPAAYPGGGYGSGYDFEITLPWRSRVAHKIDQVIARTYKAALTKYKTLIICSKYISALLPVATVLLCYAIGLILDHEFIHYPVPYLSHTATGLPEKPIFAIGLTLSGLFFVPVLFANQAGLLYLRTKRRAVQRLAYLGGVASLLAAIFLVLLAVFDVATYNELHYAFALAFFCSAFVWELCEATAHFLWVNEDKANYQLRRAVIMKYLLLVTHGVGFIFFVVLSSNSECGTYMSMTDYDGCPSSHIAAAISQYIVLGLVLIYIATLSMKKYEDSILASQEYAGYNVRQRKQPRHPQPRPTINTNLSQNQRFSSISQDSGEGTSAMSSRRSYDGLLSQNHEASDANTGNEQPPQETPILNTPIARRASDLTRRMDLSTVQSHPVIPEEQQQQQQHPRNIQPLTRARKSTNSFRSARSDFSDTEIQMDDVTPLRRNADVRRAPRPASTSSFESFEPSAPPAIPETKRPSLRSPLDPAYFDVKPF